MKAVSNFFTLLLLTFLAAGQLFSQSPVKPLPVPHTWKDNDNLVLMKIVEGKRSYHAYNIKKETTSKIDLALTPVTEPSVALKRGDIFYYSPQGKEIQLTNTTEAENNPTLSPDFSLVAFTRGNDLYTIEVSTGQETRLTFDGSELILNGRASWVYFEEIFGRSGQYRAFWWSPDSRKLAFYRFDDSQVPMFPIYDASGKHGSLNRTRYPKAGDKNPEVKLGFVPSQGGEVLWADFDPSEDQYFGTPYWNSNGANIMVQWMDRDQSTFVLYDVNSYDGSKKPIYQEVQKTWIDWIEEIHFGKTGFYFVRDFEMWEHIYFQSYDGSILKRLTDGMNWGVRINYFDEQQGTIIFTARRESSLRNDIYRLTLSNAGSTNTSASRPSRISAGEYNYTMPVVSPDGSHVAAIQSNLDTPPRLVLLSDNRRGAVNKGEFKILSDSKSDDFESLSLSLPELMYTTTPEGFKLPGTIIFPAGFDSTRKYPVIVNVYGGPNSTNVMDSWRNPSPTQRMWSELGVIQVTLDNRASGHFGKEGINYVHRNLGHYELRDYIQWAEYLTSLPFVNDQKIGITGFSYGGTMTVLALTEGADYFKYGVAGAGVYDWHLYDSHYTERYMDHPDDNTEGYRKSAAVNKAALYRSESGSVLYITHGTGDDNVHFQNTLQLLDALQKEGKQFEMMLYPGAMHGYRGYQGAHSEKAVVDFWKRTLLK